MPSSIKSQNLQLLISENKIGEYDHSTQIAVKKKLDEYAKRDFPQEIELGESELDSLREYCRSKGLEECVLQDWRITSGIAEDGCRLKPIQQRNSFLDYIQFFMISIYDKFSDQLSIIKHLQNFVLSALYLNPVMMPLYVTYRKLFGNRMQGELTLAALKILEIQMLGSLEVPELSQELSESNKILKNSAKRLEYVEKSVQERMIDETPYQFFPMFIFHI